MQKDNHKIQSVHRSFAILEELHNYSDGVGLTELMGRLSLAKTTIYRGLQNLIEMGYVTQDPISTKYRATLKTFEISNKLVSNFDVLSYAKPHLDALSYEVNETVHFVVRDGLDAVYLYKIESGGLQFSSRIGQRIPLYVSGVGKAMLSLLSSKEVHEIWNNTNIEKRTHNTIVSLSDILAEVDKIKERGWALDDEENELGVRCVAVALPTPNELTAFSVTGLKARFNDEKIDELVKKCMAAKKDILKNMGMGGFK